MSKQTLKDRMDEVENVLSVIFREITKITQLHKNSNITRLEAIAAKIINDISNKIDKCECSKEILKYLKEKQS